MSGDSNEQQEAAAAVCVCVCVCPLLTLCMCPVGDERRQQGGPSGCCCRGQGNGARLPGMLAFTQLYSSVLPAYVRALLSITSFTQHY